MDSDDIKYLISISSVFMVGIIIIIFLNKCIAEEKELKEKLVNDRILRLEEIIKH